MNKTKITLAAAATLLAALPASAETISCATLPTCAELGFTDKIGVCPNEYTICPFDKTMGKCIMEAQAGDIKYSLKSSNHKGWLKCDGSSYDRNQYAELYAAIGANFGSKVPDYRGYFLRVYGSPSSSYGGSGNSNVVTPQKEQLPNITAGGGMWEANGNSSMSGAFYRSSGTGYWGTNGGLDADNYAMMFDASRSNSIYTSGGHVIPANMAVYAYIYTGRSSFAFEDANNCSQGNYFYSDGTCSADYNSSKTLLGIATQVSKYSTYVSINLTWGGNSTGTSASVASTACSGVGASVEIQSYFSRIPASVSNSVVVAASTSKCYWSNGSKVSSNGAGCSATAPYYYCYKSIRIDKK